MFKKIMVQEISIEDLGEYFRGIIKDEIAKAVPPLEDKYITQNELRKRFSSPPSRATILSWEKRSFITPHWIGGRKFYLESEIGEAIKKLRPYVKSIN
jgi:hypothetical protein